MATPRLTLWMLALALSWLPLSGSTARGADPAPTPPPSGRMDVDAMATRPPSGKDLYEKTRDDAFASYARRHPEPTAADEAVKPLLRLMAYLWVWGDPYGENLWVKGTTLAGAARKQGSNDPILRVFTELQNVVGYQYFSSLDANAVEYDRLTTQMLADDHPAAFKLWISQAALTNLAKYSAQIYPDTQAPGVWGRSRFVEQWGKAYRECIRAKVPHDHLFQLGEDAMHGTSKDEQTMSLVIAEIDRSFNESDPANPVKAELDGDYFVESAWAARGGGYVNTVTEQGWKFFHERLAKAAKILEPLYEQFPKESGTCHAMIHLETGQGRGRDRMEQWFKRALAANPDDTAAYRLKEWYLQPRWYGSTADVIAFGQECVDTKDWAAAIPVIFPVGVSNCQDDGLYRDPALWARLEKVYHEYLEHYPDAVFYRTNFAKHAYDSGHKDTAREQYKILGRNWDTHVLTADAYKRTMIDLNPP